MRNTSPIVFCFFRVFLLIFLFHLTPLTTLPLGTFLPLDFLQRYYILVPLGQFFPECRFFPSPEEFQRARVGGSETISCLDMCGAFSSCPSEWRELLTFNGWRRWGKGIGARTLNGIYGTVPHDEHVLCQNINSATLY